MTRRSPWLAVLLVIAPAALAQEPADDEAVDDPRGSAETRAAIATKLVACVEAEGQPVPPQDREVLGDVSVALAPAVTRALCEGSDSQTETCPSRVARSSCAELSAALRPGGVGGAPPSWAAGLSRALAARVSACAVEERDGSALDAEERDALAGFELELSRALGGLAAAGTCVANENLLPTCATSLAASPCDGLGARLGEDPAALARTLTPACRSMVRCGAAAMDDGGADEPSDASDLDL